MCAHTTLVHTHTQCHQTPRCSGNWLPIWHCSKSVCTLRVTSLCPSSWSHDRVCHMWRFNWKRISWLSCLDTANVLFPLKKKRLFDPQYACVTVGTLSPVFVWWCANVIWIPLCWDFFVHSRSDLETTIPKQLPANGRLTNIVNVCEPLTAQMPCPHFHFYQIKANSFISKLH